MTCVLLAFIIFFTRWTQKSRPIYKCW